MATVVEQTSQAAQTLAILIGGVWAYVKFARGRTFAYRLELTVSPQLVRSENGMFLYVTTTLKNAGLAKVPLDERLKFVSTYDAGRISWNEGRNYEWGEELLLTPIFSDHEFIEPGESITDDTVIPLPVRSASGPRDAIRIKAEIWARPTPWRREWRNLRHPVQNLRSLLPRRNYGWSAARVIPVLNNAFQGGNNERSSVRP